MLRHPRILVAALLLGCGSKAPPPAAAPAAPEAPAPAVPDLSAAIHAAVDAPDRSPEDKALDGGRKPAELLLFAGVAPGMRVAELGAGGGYTTELLARVVGPGGAVFAQNSKVLLGFVGKRWDERLAKDVMKNTVRADREFDDPLPPEAHDLDAVFLVLLYHDTVWMGVDRDKMNHAVMAALKPGCLYIIVDHSGRDGSDATETQTLHRIEEKSVREEVERAGFRLVESGDFLRNAGDARDWNDSPMAAGERRGTSDRFVLKYAKP